MWEKRLGGNTSNLSSELLFLFLESVQWDQEEIGVPPSFDRVHRNKKFSEHPLYLVRIATITNKYKTQVESVQLGKSLDLNH